MKRLLTVPILLLMLLGACSPATPTPEGTDGGAARSLILGALRPAYCQSAPWQALLLSIAIYVALPLVCGYSATGSSSPAAGQPFGL
mgnify:CR=1 FL=1